MDMWKSFRNVARNQAPTGGFAVTPGPVAYEIMLKGEAGNGAQIDSKKWGPYPLAAGAIVDIDLEL
jgi:hypothetical protein